MNWFIIWSYVLLGPGPDAEIQYKSHFFGPYTNQRACEAMAGLAIFEPNLQVIEPELERAVDEDFVCVEIVNQEPFEVTP